MHVALLWMALKLHNEKGLGYCALRYRDFENATGGAPLAQSTCNYANTRETRFESRSGRLPHVVPLISYRPTVYC